MPKVSDWAESVPMSGIRVIFDLIAGRDDIFHLEIGESDFPTPAHVVEAAVASARAGSGYTDTSGVGTLRAAIADKLRRVNGFDVTPDQIIITQGGIQGVSLIMSTLVKPGYEILLPDPTWPHFEMLTRLHGAIPTPYPLDPANGFMPDPAQVESMITDRTGLLIINTPANPSGSVFSDGLVDAFVEVAARHDLPLLSDEVYDEIIFDGRSPANAFGKDPENVLGLYSFSKTYSMTGWRIGYVVAPKWLAPTLSRIQEPLVTCLPTMTQAAAEAAITGPQDIVGEMRRSYQHRRDLAVRLFKEGGIEVDVPGGGYFLMVPLAEGVDSKQASLDLVNWNVSTTFGTAYGQVASSYLRISLVSSVSDLEGGIGRIIDWYGATGGGRNLPG
ncbi:MAG: aminotransferase class I/II-fold pyridoxal phosphate-dependent enzyme [Acidimicrobiia bacterium]|nr:aminotransferase class I/II-fold pyridoxal phosphate-dependent enzyme [bacterium]MXX63718.1 aminotransferase class I/II-fold pyridoxal phosphate-dependent enzyme [Acidimicrobiia bacterium]MYD04946.1 aminotransferase class I/II-fold pyridoxal phosphate-dependent enzyme [Acidimicrobiia bacterium]